MALTDDVIEAKLAASSSKRGAEMTRSMKRSMKCWLKGWFCNAWAEA
jgi:hypothetical protein